MSKRLKILAICGSPHKGNTYEILEVLKRSDPEIDFKTMMLSDLNLMDCVGCYSCINSGEENCPLKDDRDLIVNAGFSHGSMFLDAPFDLNWLAGHCQNIGDEEKK